MRHPWEAAYAGAGSVCFWWVLVMDWHHVFILLPLIVFMRICWAVFERLWPLC